MRGAWGRCCVPSLVAWSGYGAGVVVTGECGEVCRKNPGDRTCCVAGVGPLCPLVWPPHPHVDPLFRAWAIPPACGIGGPRAEQADRVQEEVALHQARRIVREPAMRSLGLLIRTWTRYSEPGQPRPHAEQAARVRDRWSACGMRGSPSRCRMRPIRDGSWGSRARSRCSMCIDETIATDDGVDFSVLARLKSRPSSNM